MKFRCWIEVFKDCLRIETSFDNQNQQRKKDKLLATRSSKLGWRIRFHIEDVNYEFFEKRWNKGFSVLDSFSFEISFWIKNWPFQNEVKLRIA